MPDTPPMTPFGFQKKNSIPGIRSAVHLPNGTVEIKYTDGSQISVLTPEQGGGILFTSTMGKNVHPIHYNENDLMPEVVRMKFNQLPIVLKQLMNRDGEFITSTPTHNPAALLSNRFQNMKFIR